MSAMDIGAEVVRGAVLAMVAMVIGYFMGKN